MAPLSFSGPRALEWLAELARRADRTPAPPDDPDPLGLRDTLAAVAEEVFSEPIAQEGAAADAPPAFVLGVRRRGRESGPPWLVCTPAYAPLAAGAPPWRPNADGSGLAVLLTLLEHLAAAPPERDVLALLLGARAARDDGVAGAAHWAAKPILPVAGIVALWQVGAEGLPLDLDVRSLSLPAARDMAHELLLLGRTLGHGAFAHGAQSAFPGPHVPFLERGRPAVPLAACSDLLAGTLEDTLAGCGAAALHAVGDVLLRFLRGERAA